jgi:hypothetical protein
MGHEHWSRYVATLSIAVAVVGGGGAVAASGGAPETTAICQLGGATTVTFKSVAREGVVLSWATDDRVSLAQLEMSPERKDRSISIPTPTGARILAVFIGYSSSGTAHGGNENLEVACG